MKPLPRSFYTRPTLVVAKDLLGKTLIRRIGKTVLAGVIVEVEAYRGTRDPASHTFRGRTLRNEVMFHGGGHLYVYFTYGMHYCANVVTGKEGSGEAVLLRAVEPLTGLDVMKVNRGLTRDEVATTALTNGPAKLCEAFGIGRSENGSDLLGGRIYLTEGEPIRHSQIGISPRIGIAKAKEKRWRFFVKGNAWVSR